MKIPNFSLEQVFLDNHLSKVEVRLRGQSQEVRSKKKEETKLFIPRLAKGVLQLTLALSFLVFSLVLGPWLYYTFAPVETVPVQATEEGSTLGGEYTAHTPRVVALPPKDETLPQGSWISIPSIGVRTELRATEDPEEALRKGVWLAPEHGQPGATDQPMIVVAHRFGYKVWWQDDYWKYNSFYFLPNTQPGDLVEVIHDQRKWVYEIYAGEEGEDITDYSADMILYTCKYLNSPIRHFRYARLIDTTQDTQK